MLRTTITRIRKVCSIAFLPRILRGDQCGAAVSCAVIRKAQRSTKATDDGEKNTTDKNKDVPDYKFSTATELRIDEKKEIAEDLTGKTGDDRSQPNSSAGLPLTQRERCQRIIDQAFGPTDYPQPEPVLSEQYFSHTINLENTRREIHESEKAKQKLQDSKLLMDPILPDDRTQCSIFKMSRELNLPVEDDPDEIVIMDSTSPEPDMSKNSEHVKEETPPVEEPNLVQAKEDFDKSVNNSESVETKALFDVDAESIEVVKDERKSDLYQKVTPAYKPQQVPWLINYTTAKEANVNQAKEDAEVKEDAATVKMAQSLKSQTRPVVNATTAKDDEERLTRKLETIDKTPIVTAQKLNLERFYLTPRILGKEPSESDTIENQLNTPDIQPTPRVLNVSTAKEDEELLTEKLETIDKTPIVEAQKPNLERFKVTPRVLEKEPSKSDTIENQLNKPDIQPTPPVLNVSTAKEDEELLTQKLETIDKTPIVQAQKPNLERFKVTPRVLENEPSKSDTIENQLNTPDIQPTPRVLNVSTVKEDEELLTEKLETIDKTPMVEAQKPNLERFKVTPRALGKEPSKSDTMENQGNTADNQPQTPPVLNATSAKDDEELLTRNLETIGDTPIVEAQKPKVEGFIVTPRVLGHEPINRNIMENQGSTDHPNNQLRTPPILNATSAKEEEELLTQKLETIEETPIVEAQKPKLEGFNVTPRVLGHEPINRNIMDNQESTPNNQLRTPPIINATSAKAEEELLAQKLETIEETPIVEAQKPKLEGFNVTPRVLGHDPMSYNIVQNYQEHAPIVDLPSAFDEVSKRCLNCPVGQIDEVLINEMERLGMTSKNTQKAPSTPMEDDDLVQMDVLIKQTNSSIEEEFEEEENEVATDTVLADVSKDGLRKTEDIVEPSDKEAKYSLYPNHHRMQLNPMSCNLEQNNPADDYKNTTKFLQSYYLPPTHRAAGLDKMKYDYILPNSALTDKENKEPVSLEEPSHKGLLSETHTSHVCKNNQNAEPYSIQSNKGNIFSETVQNAQTSSAAAETEETSTDFDANIRSLDKRDMPPFKATMNTFKVNDNETPAQREIDDDPFYARNLAAVWDHHQNRSNPEYKPDHQDFTNIADEVVHHAQTQIRPNTVKVQGGLEKRATTHDLFIKVPFNRMSLPGEKLNKNVTEYLPTEDEITRQDLSKLFLRETSKPIPEKNTEKTSIPEEILNEHKLDPYYVLACNETCPIAPASYRSTYQNSDFVDTTETIYMKKNICESLRPKPKPILECKNMSQTQAHSMEPEPVMKATGMPKFKATGMPEMKASGMSEAKSTGMPEMTAPGMPEAKSTGMPEMNATGMPEMNATGMPENKAAAMPEIERKSVPGSMGSIPTFGEQIALSELLRRVREKSRLSCNETKSGLAVQMAGKCGRKAPQCLPTAPRSPPNNPVPPPGFGLPMLKRSPPVCKPKRKPSNKCSCSSTANDELSLELPYELSEAEVCALRSKVNLTDEVINRLQNLGKILGAVLRQTRSNAESLLARDYEPWTPIPAWKSPQKSEKKWEPGKPCGAGCPVFPKPRVSMPIDPPCDMKPCGGFPKRRSFSMLDCFTVSLGETKVYDLGNF